MSDIRKALAINAAEGVDIHIDDSSETETFDVKVTREGEEVEQHPGVTVEALCAVTSDHFSVELVAAPTAPEPESDDDAPGNE
jgi:hypothetical protein